MKIGILTFHWATNYGAVLQCYALQTYLESLGHEVKVINYKPKRYDFSLWRFFRYRQFLHPKAFVLTQIKEKSISAFRNKYLKLTERVFCREELPSIAKNLDAVITGSDQILNVSFLLHGDALNHITPTYYLGFDFEGKRVGYAVSFGVVEYPQRCVEIAKPYMAKFDKISTRETTGLKIVEAMGRNDAVVVPDPTILLSSTEYEKFANTSEIRNFADIFCFFIRHIAERKRAINPLKLKGNVLWNNEDGDYSLEGWLAKIKQASFVVTDSFHCMVMCLKLHTPFVVVTELEGNTGMNDRLYTLLELLDMEDRIVYKDDIVKLNTIISANINWDGVDEKIEDYKSIGTRFLQSI